MTEQATQESNVKTLPQRKPRTRSGVPVMPLVPTTVDECWQMARYFSESGVIPSSYPGRKGDQENIAAVFGAIQMGASVGLPPIQAVANIMVVNGKFAMYGDGQLAVARDSGELEEFKETYAGADPTGTPLKDWPNDFKAVCTLKRRGEAKEIVEFSVGDARTAGLWMKKTKSGGDTPWTTHPKRMIKYRARAFALRDHFGDCLLGLQHSAEELQDMGNLYEQPDGTYSTDAPPPPKREDYVTAEAVQAQTEGTQEPEESEDGAAEPEAADVPALTLLDEFGEEVGTFATPAQFADAWEGQVDLCEERGIMQALDALREHNEDAIASLGSARESAEAQRIWRRWNAAREKVSAEPGAGEGKLV